MTMTIVDRSAHCHTRRAAVRLLSACALSAPVVWRSPSVLAIKGWCRRDPIIKINDVTVQIVLFSNTEMHDLATGPTKLVIQVPVGIPTRLVADDPGFGHFGYEVCFTESRELIAAGRSVDVYLEAYVPATNPAEGPLPVVLEFTRRGGGVPAVFQAEGRANDWVSLRANLAALDVDEVDDIPPPAPPIPPEDESDATPPVDVPDKKDNKKDKKGRGKKKSR